MHRFSIPLLFYCVCATSSAQTPDPWWERSDIGLPQLLAQGWEISFYISNDNGYRREYVLQHPTEDGAWHCFWHRHDVFREEPFSGSPNGIIRVPDGAKYTAYCMTIKGD